MAKRVYINSNNYFVIADNADITDDIRYPAKNVYMEKNGTLLIFYKQPSDKIIDSIYFADILNEAGAAYSSIDVFLDHIENKTSGLNEFIADETSTVAIYLLNGGSEDQAVNGSVTPVRFSYSPPTGYELICARIVFYMEGTTAFDSNLFGDITALTNGWAIEMNGVEAMSAKTNRDLGTYMYDMKGDEIYGKVNRTIIGRFSFNKFTDGADGITIRDGESFITVVRDDLSSLTYLEAKIMGVLKKV